MAVQKRCEMRSTRGGTCATATITPIADADARGLAQEHPEVFASGAEQHDEPGRTTAHTESSSGPSRCSASSSRPVKVKVRCARLE